MKPKSIHEDIEQLKPKGVEYIPYKSLIEKNKNKFNKMEIKGMTLKSVIVIVLVAIVQAVLSIWFDENTTTQIVQVIQQVLNALFGVAVGTALYGIRRRV